jgi:PAS domain S-box-containing protein
LISLLRRGPSGRHRTQHRHRENCQALKKHTLSHHPVLLRTAPQIDFYAINAKNFAVFIKGKQAPEQRCGSGDGEKSDQDDDNEHRSGMTCSRLAHNLSYGALNTMAQLRYTFAMDAESMIRASPIAAVISNPRLPNNPIIACNEAFIKLTGYQRSEIVGRNCRFLRGEQTEPWITDTLRAGIKAQQAILVEILNYKKDGTPFRNAVMIAPIFDSSGDIEYFIGSQVEIGEDVAEARLSRKPAALDKVNGLTKRQRQILLLMAAGKLNKQIAYELGLSERTVKMHRSAVFRALDVRTSADAIRIAIEAGF